MFPHIPNSKFSKFTFVIFYILCQGFVKVNEKTNRHKGVLYVAHSPMTLKYT